MDSPRNDVASATYGCVNFRGFRQLLGAIFIWFALVQTEKIWLGKLNADRTSNRELTVEVPRQFCAAVSDLVKVGGDVRERYGAWWLCRKTLVAKPRVLSLGVGEDATFERAMVRDFGAEVWAFDPTPKAARYVAHFTGLPDASFWAYRFHFEEVGVGEEKGTVELTLPENPDHVSGRVGGTNCINCNKIAVRVESLHDLLQRAGGHVDVLKMDVETMEFTVLSQILDLPCTRIPFEQLLVEYHDMDKNARQMETHQVYFASCGFRRFKFGPEVGTFAFLRTPKIVEKQHSLPSNTTCEQFEDLKQVGGDIEPGYGAWWVCVSALPAVPRILSLGVGEDASFERGMVDRFGAEVWAFDPTPKSARYVAKFSTAFGGSNWSAKFHFEKVGVGIRDGNAELILPSNPNHVSGRIRDGCINCKYVPVRLETLDHLLQRAGGHVDVLKMDVETMEFSVLDQVLQKPCSQIPFTQLLVEYHDIQKNINKMKQHRSSLNECGFHRIKIGSEPGTYIFLPKPH